MAERVGVINQGSLILVQEKEELMRRLGNKQVRLHLHQPLEAVPESLSGFDLEFVPESCELVYTYHSQRERTGVTVLLDALSDAGITFHDLDTKQSSLEEIFVNLVTWEK